MEYFRSRDFVELLKKHPGLMAGIIAEDQIAVEESRASMASALLLRGLIVRCDRAVKTIRQGRKKLSKWPAKLAVHSVRQSTCHPLSSLLSPMFLAGHPHVCRKTDSQTMLVLGTLSS